MSGTTLSGTTLSGITRCSIKCCTFIASSLALSSPNDSGGIGGSTVTSICVLP
ncbi:MAG: hypothetical protein ACNYPE_09235 [Candidatus Azotimanducaceae bacterium WSBS_2022_MAG_OTU7]